MSRRSVLVVAAVVFSAAVAVHGQTIVVGDIPATSNFTTVAKDTPVTIIDLSHPTITDGTVTSVSIRWSGGAAACSNAFTIRFFRSAGPFDSLSLVAERGPFSVPAGSSLSSFDLSAPVALAKGDLIGVSARTGCGGGVAGSFGDPRDLLVVLNSDYSEGSLSDAQVSRGSRVAVRANSPPATLAGIIPVAGATTGQFGSSFRTTLQVTNVSAETATTTLVYHPGESIGNTNDPTVNVSLGANSTTTIELLDVLHLTGVGSVDVLTTGAPPLVTARVYNDTGSGTNGFTETIMPVTAALTGSQRANIVLPADFANFRMNIGVRTLDNGATITATAYDSAGAKVGTITKIYPGNYFVQKSVQEFLTPVPASAGMTIDLLVSAGNAFVYSSTTDNRTNDSAIYFARYR